MNGIQFSSRNAVATHPALTAEQKELARLKKACCEFEALLVKQLFAEMRKSATEGWMGGNFQAKFYEDFLDDAIAKQITTGKGIGISEMLYSQMKEVVLSRFSNRAESQDGKIRESSSAPQKNNGGRSPAEKILLKEKTS
ncbi:MAG TPA: rod-binding protein [Fimbriimonadales bacterium]|nr:rod-binding protein [Fimbriimonadales bacterium]